MSVPDLMLSMLHAAGVDPKTQPVTWHVGMNADGTIFGHMCFDPNIVSTADSHDKAEPSHCVGKRQPGVFVAGQRQSHSPAPLPLDSASQHFLIDPLCPLLDPASRSPTL